MYINPSSFYQWWDVFHSDNPLTEIRLIGKKGDPYSGYFKSCEAALKAIEDFPYEGYAVYSPINKIQESCYGREQSNQLMQVKKTTSGSDIEGRRWIMIDLDPKRASDTNSTDAEKEIARKMMIDVGSFLRDQGFSAPVVADSANGYHLYYRVQLSADTKDTLVENFLRTIDMLFSNDGCDIDVKVSDPNRISKVMGTRSVKGAKNVKDRPQRESSFIRVPDEIKVTDRSVVENVAAMLPQREKPSKFNNYSTTPFDIDAFIAKYNIGIAKVADWKDGKKYILSECPFDSNHKAPDAAIFVSNSGAIGFKCLHNSCANYTWKDVRLHFDPEAYSHYDRMQYERKRDYYSTAPRPKPIVVEENDKNGRKWMNMSDIEWQDPSKLVYIPTGLKTLDKAIGGLALGDVSIISGLAGAGKSTMLDVFVLNAIQHGYKAAIWSGELSPSRFKSWFNQNAAGRNYVKKGVSSSGQEYWFCPSDIEAKIDAWTKGKIFLYNNNYGNHSSQILDDIKKCVKDNGTQLVILDNKMAMSLDSYEGDKLQKEAGLINELKDFAIASQIHIILVCHPRKEIMNTLLRMESIAGNSDLYNCACNVFLCHRVGKDFDKRATQFFGKTFVEEIQSGMYNEVVEIAKNRSHGKSDTVFGLHFEEQTRRYLNTIGEYVAYGWQDNEWQKYLPTADDVAVPKVETPPPVRDNYREIIPSDFDGDGDEEGIPF